jgi:peptidoglycan/LPS O-acetylase OafA/YrhL
MNLSNRLSYWDTARVTLVLLVTALHAAAAYASVIPWWHVRGQETAPFFDLVMSVLDGFLMPTLFFIAGCFAPGSLDRTGPAGFFRAKVLRFGPTLFVYMVTLLPLMTYVGYVSRTPYPMGFPAYFMNWLASAADVGPHLYTTIEDGLATRDIMSTHHLWFLVALVGLFGGYALWRAVSRTRQDRQDRAGTRRPVRLSMLVAAGCAMALACSLVALAVPDGGWFKATALVVVQPTRLPLYAGFFGLGAYAAATGGLAAPWPGRWWAWLAVAVAGLGVMFVAYPAVVTPVRESPGMVFVHYLGRAFLCLGVAGFLTCRATRRNGSGNKAPGRLSRALAASSYHVYLLHMPVVVLLQYLLLDAALSLYVTYGAVWLGAVIVSVLASRMWRGAAARVQGRSGGAAAAR